MDRSQVHVHVHLRVRVRGVCVCVCMLMYTCTCTCMTHELLVVQEAERVQQLDCEASDQPQRYACYHTICKDMLRCAAVCHGMLLFASICHHMPRYPTIQALEAVALENIEQADREQLRDDAEVVAEREARSHPEAAAYACACACTCAVVCAFACRSTYEGARARA